jgi:hypothetical protein
MDDHFSKLIITLQNHYNTPGWTSQGKGCPSCCVWMKDPVRHGHLIGEKSAVIYWLCNDCAEKMDSNEILERIASNLTGK